MLGFRVSDWRSDFFAFLRCSRDHHTVNFLRDAKPAIHHIARSTGTYAEEESPPTPIGTLSPGHRFAAPSVRNF